LLEEAFRDEGFATPSLTGALTEGLIGTFFSIRACDTVASVAVSDVPLTPPPPPWDGLVAGGDSGVALDRGDG